MKNLKVRPTPRFGRGTASTKDLMTSWARVEAAVARRDAPYTSVVWTARLGYLSLPLLFLGGLGVFLALGALVTGVRALREIAQDHPRSINRGVVETAMVCAGVTLALGASAAAAAGLAIVAGGLA